ncbi:MAG TPA: acyl carrier protein [Pilimelia sp.]|nr:acyl carrier protein [Pilimelia sp.]
MTPTAFSLIDLGTILVRHAGLDTRTDACEPDRTLADVGLDSLAFLQLQAALTARFGFALPDTAADRTFGEMVAYVNHRLAADGERAA